MRAKIKEMNKKVLDILIDTEGYVPAKEISKKCGMCTNSIYRLIRKMKEEGMGIMPGRKGYILAQFASKKDDVHLLRLVNGRHVSDAITLRSALPFMKKRWASLEDKKSLDLITGPLVVHYGNLKKNMHVIIEKEKSLEV